MKKNTIIFLLLFLCYSFKTSTSNAQSFIKSYKINNLQTQFVSSCEGYEVNQKIVLGQANEQLNLTQRDVVLLKMNESGSAIGSEIIKMPGSDETGLSIIKISNKRYLISGGTDIYDNQDLMLLIVDENFTVLKSYIYRVNGYQSTGAILETSKGDFLIAGWNAPDLFDTNYRRPIIYKIDGITFDIETIKILEGDDSFYFTSFIEINENEKDILLSGTYLNYNLESLQPSLILLDSTVSNVKWRKTYLGSEFGYNNGFGQIKQISNGEILTVGGARGFKNQTLQTGQDALFMKMSSTGDFITAKAYSSINNEASYSIQELDGNIFIQGYGINGNSFTSDIWYMQTDLSGNIKDKMRTGQSLTDENTINFGTDNFSVFKSSNDKYGIMGTGFSGNAAQEGVYFKAKFADSSSCITNLDFISTDIIPVVQSRAAQLISISGIKSNGNAFSMASVTQKDYCEVTTFIDTIATIPPSIYEFDIKLNPASTYTTIDFETSEGNDYFTLQIYNVLGQKIATLIDNQLLTGKNSVRWDCANYSNGSYYVVLIRNGSIDTRKLLIMNNGR